MTEKRVFSPKKIAFIGIFGALSWVLTFLKFPIAYLGFLELECSDIPAIVGGITLGPMVAVFIELIKNALHVFTSSTAGVGEIANFIICCGYVLPISIIAGKAKFKGKFIAASIAATLGLMLVGAVVNYWITVPMYVQLYFGGNQGGADALMTVANAAKLGFIPEFESLSQVVILGITPFNFVKGIMLSVLGGLCYKALKNPIAQIMEGSN